MTYHHGSGKKLEIGTILVPNTEQYLDSWGKNQWDAILEGQRPADKLPREKAIFLIGDDLDDLDGCGAVDDYVYEVEPLGDYLSKHDMRWISEIEILLENEDDNMDAIIEAAKNYWTSVPHPDESLWEYLVPKAKIKRLAE